MPSPHPRHALFIRAASWLERFYVIRSKDQLLERLEPVSASVQSCVDELRSYESQLLRASRRGFTTCQPRLKARYERALTSLAQRIEQMHHRWRQPWAKPPSCRVLFEELKALDEELGPVEISFIDKTIAVQTDRIILDGVPLGSFRVVVEVTAIACRTPSDWYRVEAIDPNPASSNDQIVHPHVDGDHLCAGDALVPISNALTQGRLCDFAMLIKSVLETYNPHSAYIELEQWDGVTCHDCGEITDQDDSIFCERCEHDYCTRCTAMCEVCNQVYCCGCGERSQLSEQWVCEPCLETCESCGKRAARTELEDHLCPACLDRREADQQENPTNAPGTQTIPATPGNSKQQPIANTIPHARSDASSKEPSEPNERNDEAASAPAPDHTQPALYPQGENPRPDLRPPRLAQTPVSLPRRRD